MFKGIGWCLAAMSVGLLAMGAEEATGKRGTPNRLAQSKSPYLLQHAYNPVDWYPWGEEAFEKARKEKKPILLSIGYSTCHWCHVMERESFQSTEVAEFLNKHFVSIKLDREERPDVDRVYMTAFQAMMGEGGGWPLNMFLTPDLKPFFGGTYFPPEDRGGRAGFLSALKQLHGAWTDKNGEVVGVANDIHTKLTEMVAESQTLSAGKEQLTAELITRSANALVSPENGADQAHGGWGRGPKFPQPSHLRFLMRCGDEEARKFALHTCRKMMAGGIHDQLGGGFHRYAVDGVWLVPHFEKMLYDQAQLLDVYVEAWLLSGEEAFREAAEGIVEYVAVNLTHPEGAFYSAQDAQSEGKEGKYWCWTEKELQALLKADEFKLVKRWFGVTAKGNFLDHSDPEPLPDQNVLFRADPGAKLGADEQSTLAGAIAKMKEARAKRVPPATDDKVLASWNGLMIASLARAGRFLQKAEYLEAARKAHACVVAKLWDEDKKRLAHRWRDGDVDASQQAESYLYLLRGTRALYEATLDEDYLSFAVALAEGARARFYDEVNGGFYDGEKREDLVIRMKGDFDSATPTAGSVASYEYLVLAELTGRAEYREIAEKTLRAAIPTIERAPASLTGSLVSLDFYVSKPGRLVIAGGDRIEEFLSAAWSAYQRNLVVMGNRGPVDAFTKTLQPEGDTTTAFYCVGQVCRLPETDPKQVATWLQEAPEGPGAPGKDTPE